jgi:hypothetical protein
LPEREVKTPEIQKILDDLKGIKIDLDNIMDETKGMKRDTAQLEDEINKLLDSTKFA